MQTVFRFGELTLDCGTHLLLRHGVEQHLSPKAHQLLRLLLVHRPDAVSREQLYNALWPSTFVCEANLSSVISEVRRALGDHGRSSQYIRTVHGFGYAFSGDVTTSKGQRRPVATLLCEGQRHLLYDGENSVGRAQDCSVLLTGAAVSRYHALIVVTDREISIEDLDSRNGTYVDGQKIRSSIIVCEERIVFGDVEARIVRKNPPTIPLPMNGAGPRRRSSGSVTIA
jgi:DNA-binding winged helix-turn-helix (wHTH) protein